MHHFLCRIFIVRAFFVVASVGQIGAAFLILLLVIYIFRGAVGSLNTTKCTDVNTMEKKNVYLPDWTA